MDYRVKALSVSGIGKKIHYLNETVNESHFPAAGRLEELASKGFLEPIATVPFGSAQGTLITAPEGEKGETTFNQEGSEEKGTVEETDTNDPPSMMSAYEDISIPKLKEWLNEKKIEFNATAKKEVLYELYKSNWNKAPEE